PAAAGLAHSTVGAAQLDAVAVRRQHGPAGGGGDPRRRPRFGTLAGSGRDAVPAVRTAQADHADDGGVVSASAPAAAGLEGYRDRRLADRDSGGADRRATGPGHRGAGG